MADISGANPAFVASPSSQEVVSTEGFNRGELLRCPFCGNHGVGPAFVCEQGRWDFWQVECGTCDFSIENECGFEGEAAKQAAIMRWNTRAPQSTGEKP